MKINYLALFVFFIFIFFFIFILNFFTSCTCEDTFQVEHWDKKLGENNINTNYPCNEIVFSYSANFNPEDVHTYLDSLGFKEEKNCPCNNGLELWRRDEIWDPVGLEGVITGGKQVADNVGGGGTGTLSKNYDINIPPEFKLNDTTTIDPFVNIGTDSEPIIIAIIDSGVDNNNPHLSGFLWNEPGLETDCIELAVEYGLDIVTPDEEPDDLIGHGTFVSGRAAGFRRTPVTNVGVSLKILTVKFTKETSQSGDLNDVLCGAYFAMEQGADVLNLSLGFWANEEPEPLRMLMEDAKNNNISVVAAMGNDSAHIDKKVKFWPAAFANNNLLDVISVGAINHDNSFAEFSNWGDDSWMTLTAPGVDVISTYPRAQSLRGLAIASGTSYAAPTVAYTVAILKGLKPDATSAKIKAHLINTSDMLNQDIIGAPYRVLNHERAIWE